MESNRKILVYRPAYLWLAGAVVAVVLVGAGYWLFQRGMHYAGTELEWFEQRASELEQQLDAFMASVRAGIETLERKPEAEEAPAPEEDTPDPEQTV